MESHLDKWENISRNKKNPITLYQTDQIYPKRVRK